MPKLQIDPCLEGHAHRWKVDTPEGTKKVWQECRWCNIRVEMWAAGPPDYAKKSFNLKGGRSVRADFDFTREAKCSHCDRTFTNKGGLVSHRRGAHGIR